MDNISNHRTSVLESVLAGAGVHVRNRDDVMQKVAAIAQDGPDKLLFLSDFDQTLTRYWVNGKRGFTSYKVVEISPLMSEDYREKARQLADKYHPIEVAVDISLEEKIQHMVKWWEGNHELMIGERIKRSQLKEMVANANIQFRDKCEELFRELDSFNIPLLVFSAGLGDTLLEVFRQFSAVRPNLHVVSNRLVFDEAGVAVSHSHPLVHSYNKGKSPEQLAAVESFIVGRSNVILAGDSQGDPKMADSLPHTHHVLKIGFLNHDVKDLLDLYMDIYDIVLTGDCDMTVVNAVMQTVLHPPSLLVSQ
jgi:HAD superfamily hydrolase (TIGR01544 family)